MKGIHAIKGAVNSIDRNFYLSLEEDWQRYLYEEMIADLELKCEVKKKELKNLLAQHNPLCVTMDGEEFFGCGIKSGQDAFWGDIREMVQR
ncbi:MAG: hypothetical protein AAGG68_14770 [Bacteroidota bacterium]